MVPHAPQWLGSSRSTTQDEPQRDLLPLQTQVPPEQTWSLAQRLPHVPQFRESVWVSTQTEPHLVGVAPPQLAAHAPAEQTGVAPLQAVPQAPQFWGSFCVLTQIDPHRVGVTPTQVAKHIPPEQTGLTEQAEPQEPQLRRSSRVLAQ